MQHVQVQAASLMAVTAPCLCSQGSASLGKSLSSTSNGSGISGSRTHARSMPKSSSSGPASLLPVQHAACIAWRKVEHSLAQTVCDLAVPCSKDACMAAWGYDMSSVHAWASMQGPDAAANQHPSHASSSMTAAALTAHSHASEADAATEVHTLRGLSCLGCCP